jgi:hypothetical protein
MACRRRRRALTLPVTLPRSPSPSPSPRHPLCPVSARMRRYGGMLPPPSRETLMLMAELEKTGVLEGIGERATRMESNPSLVKHGASAVIANADDHGDDRKNAPAAIFKAAMRRGGRRRMSIAQVGARERETPPLPPPRCACAGRARACAVALCERGQRERGHASEASASEATRARPARARPREGATEMRHWICVGSAWCARGGVRRLRRCRS